MLASTIRFWSKGWIEELYINPKFYFTYYGFDWIKPLSENGMYLVFGALILSSILITLGLFYRVAIIIFFLLFTYIELIDKTNYLNHYYFISLISLLLCFVPANAYFSLDVKLGFRKQLKFIPAWCINIFKFQIGCVYFFAGVAKLNYYWLFEAEPLNNWLKHQTDLPLIGGFMKHNATAYIFAWTGCIFDLTVPFLLLMSRTRLIAYSFIIFFHVITGIMFPIGVFPLVMIALTTIFFANEWFAQVFEKVSKKTNNSSIYIYTPKFSVIIICSYIAIQLLIPFRYLLYPGNLFWSEQGYRFSWRVMLIEKVGSVDFYVSPEDDSRNKVIDLSNYLTPQQIKQMSTQPDMILQFAHYLRDQYHHQVIIEQNDTIIMGNPQVFVIAHANLFNKGSQLLIDPEIDLAKEKHNLYNRNWITHYDK